MDHEAAQPRGEEKSRLILDQVASIRGRLNALALQKGLFGGLTFILCAAVLIVGAAFAFSPLTFLLLGIAVTAAAVAGVARTARAAWRMRTSDERAARIADERAALKGRLTTMVAMRVEPRSSLWPYLIEDTLALREQFAAARVEPRRLSRWLWAALISCAVAVMVMRLAYGVRTARLGANNRTVNVPGEATADLGDLDIRPADPSTEPGTEIDADPATLRKLAEKLREAQRGGQQGSPTSRLMANARDAASALQNKLTGGKPAEPAPRLRAYRQKGRQRGQSPQPRAKTTRRQKALRIIRKIPIAGQQSDQNQTQPNSAPTPGMPDMSGLAALNGLNNDDPDPNGSPPRTRHPTPQTPARVDHSARAARTTALAATRGIFMAKPTSRRSATTLSEFRSRSDRPTTDRATRRRPRRRNAQEHAQCEPGSRRTLRARIYPGFGPGDD